MTRTTITLPDTVWTDIDALVGPRGRSGFLARAERNELKRERLRRALDTARGAMVGTPPLPRRRLALKALTTFNDGDLPSLTDEHRERLRDAARGVGRIPVVGTRLPAILPEATALKS